jgi:hypothetical protein
MSVLRGRQPLGGAKSLKDWRNSNMGKPIAEKCLRVVLRVAVAGFLFLPTSQSAHAASPAPCLASFTSPLAVPVSGTLTEVFIDDLCQHVYLTNSTTNQVEVFSLQTLTLDSPIQVGSLPTGLDASPSGKLLYVANSGGNNFSIVDLAKGVERRKVNVPPGFDNDTPLSIAVARNGLVLFSTTFAGSGFGGRMMQFDPKTNTVSQRTDFFINGTTTEVTYLRASGNRSAVGVVAGDISSGPVFRYSSKANVFSKEKDLNAFVYDVALNRNGSKLIVSTGTYVLDSTLSLLGTIPGGDFGVAVDPTGAIGYRVGPPDIDVLDLITFTETGTLAIGDTVARAGSFRHGVGSMTISRDGGILAVITDHGFSVVHP